MTCNTGHVTCYLKLENPALGRSNPYQSGICATATSTPRHMVGEAHVYVQAPAKDMRDLSLIGFETPPITSNQAGGIFAGALMFFRREKLIIRKPPIEIAINMLSHAMIIAYGYKHNKQHILTENELKMMDIFVEELEKNHSIAVYISRCLYQRSKGLVEGSPKFTNPDSFDYHFPK